MLHLFVNVQETLFQLFWNCKYHSRILHLRACFPYAISLAFLMQYQKICIFCFISTGFTLKSANIISEFFHFLWSMSVHSDDTHFFWTKKKKKTGGTPEVRFDKSLTLLTFDIWYLTFDFWHLTFDIWHLTFDIWHSTFNKWTNGPKDQWNNGSTDRWADWQMVQWTSGPIGTWSNGPIKQCTMR